jgi:hypothetical protein
MVFVKLFGLEVFIGVIGDLGVPEGSQGSRRRGKGIEKP